MQYQGTSVLDRPEVSPAAASDVYALADELTYGELAVALYASDMPTRRRAAWSAAPDQVAAWAAQGVARLGRARVWQLDYRSRQSALRPGDEYEAIWPDSRRAGTANGVGYLFAMDRQQCGHPRPADGGVVYVEVPASDPVFTWQYPVSRRDLADARRWGWPEPVTAATGRVPAPDELAVTR